MRSTTKILSLLLLVLSVALVGCGGAEKAAEKKSAEPFRIVTSFYPMYVATINITDGVDGVEVHNMTKPQTGCLQVGQRRVFRRCTGLAGACASARPRPCPLPHPLLHLPLHLLP